MAAFAVDQEESKNWRSILFRCSTNYTMCFCTLCFPIGGAIMQCQNTKLLSDEQTAGKSGCIAFCCAFWCGCIGLAFNRTTVRTLLKIEGSFVQDLLCHCCCCCCALSQEWREVMFEKFGDETRTICNYKETPTTTHN